MDSSVPHDLPTLLKLIDSKELELSHQFHQVARYMVANPDEVALAPVRVLAGHIGAHPSTIVRFAKALNYKGFKEMQLVFKSGVYSRAQGTNSKVSRLDGELARRGKSNVDDEARNVVAGEITILEKLLEGLSTRDLEHAVKMIVGARVVWILSDLDAFAVGWQFARILNRLSCEARHLEAATPRAQEQMRMAKASDVIVAISLAPDRAKHGFPEVDIAIDIGCRSITISNGARIREQTDVSFVLPSTDAQPTPSLSSSLTFVHVLGRHVAALVSPERLRTTQFAGFDPLGW
jgi:DNA-binding MurR/RpiR family transcriptional regulator